MGNPQNLVGQGFHTHPERIHPGRPKGARNRSTIVRELLEAVLDGSNQKVVDAMTKSVIAEAMDGNVNAWEKLMDSAYGKIADKSETNVTVTVTKEHRLAAIEAQRGVQVIDALPVSPKEWVAE